jgi:hypothetical protein
LREPVARCPSVRKVRDLHPGIGHRIGATNMPFS